MALKTALEIGKKLKELHPEWKADAYELADGVSASDPKEIRDGVALYDEEYEITNMEEEGGHTA